MTFANERRGLTIAGTNFRWFSEGANALLFVDQDRGLVRKVFRRRADRTAEQTQLVFDAEASAYEIAQASVELNSIIPWYAGRVEVSRIVDKTGRDVSDEVHLDMAFEIEFVTGSFEKFGSVPEDERSRVGSLFRKRQIHYIEDASVVLENGCVSKVIDFATQGYEEHW